MKLVVQVKLILEPDQAPVLAASLRKINAEANRVSALAHRRGCKGRTRKALQALVYTGLKDQGLSAQPALHVIRKVADAYTTLKADTKAGNLRGRRRVKAFAKPISFRPDAAQPYDDRCLSWQYDAQTVSIWTTAGRLKNVRFACSPKALKLLRETRRGETDLLLRDGKFFLIATCEVSEAVRFKPDGRLGVDLGVTNIATTSDGEILAGRSLNRYRRRQLRLRAKLQRKGTKSAIRVLKRQRRKESRKATETNHIISKRIVVEAERTGRGISLEDLQGIRDRVRLRKPQRTALHSWAFAQLGGFISYKAKRAGVPVVFVNPAYTSRMCAECGHVDKKNRVSQAIFACRDCGVVAHADRNASRNIAARAAFVWDSGAPSLAPHSPRVLDAAEPPQPVVVTSGKRGLSRIA